MPVYLIRAGMAGDVKIGVSENPLARLRGIQTSHPQKLSLMRVLDGGAPEERALHRRFAPQRKAGEWFSYTEDMRGDLGLSDLPIPFPKRQSGSGCLAYTQRSDLHEEIVSELGGVNAVAKRIGVAPWVLCNHVHIDPKYFSAVALLMRDAGHMHVTVDLLLEIEAACNAEMMRSEAEMIANKDAGIKKFRDERFAGLQSAWIDTHGRETAWWLPIGAAEEGGN